MRLRPPWTTPHREPQRGDRLGPSLRNLHQRLAKIVLHLRVIGLEPQRFLVFVDRIRQPPRKLRQGPAAIALRICLVALDPQRLLEGRNRLKQMSRCLHQLFAMAIVAFGEGRNDCDHLAKLLARLGGGRGRFPVGQ